ncbi:unnamed protein product [Fraxinus pennsylvanica]|uniref:C2H2-type domain-containing protein n=1 Tax=Fraxinus pennsylvanica TaxID=56036 RepID=A0AAD1ZGG5_9LAMI|nr:unnamed protein product [Fraxinus pennsylvanica]
MVPEEIKSFNKRRKRSHFYRKPTDVEYTALALLRLSRCDEDYWIRPTTTVEWRKQAPTTTARISASDSVNVIKDIEQCSPPAQKHESHECDVCVKSVLSHQALGGYKISHLDSSQFATATCPTISPDAAEIVEDVNPAVASTSERTGALASTGDDKKSTEPFCPTITASPPAQNHESHECDVCGKSFLTYQALGGHKTSHRDRAQFATTTAITIASNVSYLNPSGRIHECHKCYKTFSTGQALGGHMRRHYDKLISSCKKTNVMTSAGGASSHCNSNGHVVHDFDLNLPALPEDESPIP